MAKCSIEGTASSLCSEKSVSTPPAQLFTKQFPGPYSRPTESEFLCREPRNLHFFICTYKISFKKHGFAPSVFYTLA